MNYLREVLRAGVLGTELPAGQIWNQWKHRSLGKSHCKECLMLDGCWFAAEKTPQWPHHFYCHCALENIPYYDVVTKSSAYCAYSKFDPYLFDSENTYGHGKGKMFESWGVFYFRFGLATKRNSKAGDGKIYIRRLYIRKIKSRRSTNQYTD